MKKYFHYTLMLIPLFAVESCKKFVEVDPPGSQQTTDNVFKNSITANGAIVTIYAQMISGSASGYHIGLYTGLAADELAKPPDDYTTEIYTNNVNANRNLHIADLWAAGYDYIYQANVAYENCDKSTKLNPAVKKQLMAEALFIRAYWHFYLINFFGDVPLVTTSDYTKNMVLPRAPTAQVYEQIVTDLESAQANLSVNYVGADGITPTNERIRPNQATATAFLARVYLYMENYQEAADLATAVINLSGIYTLDTPEKAFLKDSKEAIWQLRAPAENFLKMNTPEGKGFIINGLTTLDKQPAISTQLYAAFEKGDLRKQHWLGSYQNNHFSFKYKVKRDSVISEHSVVFRLAEQYLIRAECRVQLGAIKEAIGDIDIIRERAGLPLLANMQPNLNKDEVVMAILKERQVELFTEQGQRWFDLKRTNKVDSTMKMVTPFKGGAWQTEWRVWPVPYIEIRKNGNLKQNPGYD